MSDQQANFQARLDRMGMEDRPPPPSSAPRKSIATRAVDDTFLGRLWYPLSYVAAFGLGYTMVLLMRYVRWNGLGMQGNIAVQADLTIFLDVVMASAAGFVISFFVKMKTKEHAAAQTFGVFGALVSAHNLVWWFPGLFAALYTSEWVEATLRMTVANSFHFRGFTFVF